MLYRRRTPAQIAASRCNGARSRGPTSSEGKRNSSGHASPNRKSYSKAAKSILLPGESETDFTRVAQQLENRFVPRDAVEAMLVQRMIVARWQILRTWNFERLTLGLLSAPEDNSEHPRLRSLSNFLDLHAQSRVGKVLQISAQRYQSQFDRAVSQLDQIRGNVNLRVIPTSACKQKEMVESCEPTADPANPTTNPEPTHPDPRSSQREPNPSDDSETGVA